MKLQQITGVTLLAAFSIATASIAHERKIKCSELPPEVEKTVTDQGTGAPSEGFSEEKENREFI